MRVRVRERERERELSRLPQPGELSGPLHMSTSRVH